MKDINIKIPDNCKLVKLDEETYKVTKVNKPCSWREFCKNVSTKTEYLIDRDSRIVPLKPGEFPRDEVEDRNLFNSKEDAEAFLALIQLRRLIIEWDKYEEITCDSIFTYFISWNSHHNQFWIQTEFKRGFLAFSTRTAAEEFLDCFRDLLFQARMFL